VTGAIPTGFNVTDGAAIFEPLPPVEWLVRGILVAPGAPTIVAGYGYSGKSVATAALALSVATGRRLWGKFEVRRGRVLHLDYEQGRRLTLERYQRMCFADAIDPSELPHGQLEMGMLPSVGLDKVGDLERFGEGRALVIVDSWRASHPSVDENSSEVRVTLDRMSIASEKTKAVFLFLHHSRKDTKDSKDEAQGIRGSGGFFDGCQTVYTFVGLPGEGKDNVAKVTLKKDRLTGVRDFGFELVVSDTDGDRGLIVRHRPRPDEKAPPSASNKFDGLMREVEECVLQNPGLAGADVVALKVGRKVSEVRAAVASLVSAGVIRRIESSGKGRGCRLYHSSYHFNGAAPF
jgi:AAA domain